MNEKIYTDPELGRIVLRKSVKSKRISLRVHPVRGITVTIPFFTPYEAGIRFYASKRDWVIDTVARQKASLEANPLLTPEQIETIRRAARQAIPRKLAILAARYGFTYNRVALKNNRTNWGSCSNKDNINLNINLVRIPEVLCDYVILHELCHLKYRDHGTRFHALLEQLCADNLIHLISKYAVPPDETLSQERKQGWLEEAEYIHRLQGMVQKSRSLEPYRYVMEQQLRKYRLQ